MQSAVRRFFAASLLALGLTHSHSVEASSLVPYCQPTATTSVEQQDKMLRVADVLRAELERANASVAMISRAGLDLARFGIRYSHAGLSLKSSANGAWSVRQLYFACDEQKPKIFDQGLAGFILGADNPDAGFIRVVYLPAEAATTLEASALDNPSALSFLSARYSANAFAFSTLYQNCNQWLIELMAHAWGGATNRQQAQDWLKKNGYRGSNVQVWNPFVKWLASFSAFLNSDDHPTEHANAGTYQVSMPAAIEAFLQNRYPNLEKLELCHTATHVLVRRNGPAHSSDCVAQASDTRIAWEH